MDKIRGWSFSSIPSVFCFEWEVGPALKQLHKCSNFILDESMSWKWVAEIDPVEHHHLGMTLLSKESHIHILRIHGIYLIYKSCSHWRNNHQINQPFRITPWPFDPSHLQAWLCFFHQLSGWCLEVSLGVFWGAFFFLREKSTKAPNKLTWHRKWNIDLDWRCIDVLNLNWKWWIFQQAILVYQRVWI